MLVMHKLDRCFKAGSQWSHLQKFMLDAIRPLVAAFEKLSSEEADANCMSTATSLAVFGKYQCTLQSTS